MLRRRRPKKLFYRTSHQSDDESSSSSASEIEYYRTSHQSDDDSSSSSASESDDDISTSSASEKDSVDNDERMTDLDRTTRMLQHLTGEKLRKVQEFIKSLDSSTNNTKIVSTRPQHKKACPLELCVEVAVCDAVSSSSSELS